jgi:hypothetical protein
VEIKKIHKEIRYAAIKDLNAGMFFFEKFKVKGIKANEKKKSSSQCVPIRSIRAKIKVITQLYLELFMYFLAKYHARIKNKLLIGFA